MNNYDGGSSVRVAAIQMTSTEDVERNLQTALRLTERAARDGARLIALPEAFAVLSPTRGKFEVAEELPAGGPILARFSECARKHECELVLGGFWERGRTPERVRNSCVHLTSDGAVRAVYRKIHLFDVDLPDGTKLQESASVEPGSEVVVTDTIAGKLGLSVCYDLRFPALFRQLVRRGATLLTVPSAFTLTTGKDHWHVLLRARAIESQCYVIAPAQTGCHFGSRVSYGHALICDPWGTVLAECGEGEGYALATVNHEVTQRIRRSLPNLDHAVLD
ncbi:MAG TPA: carbon-nitrogen hydrolase family protein [Polyangiaceae bacterium]|nr:carbon-nitrogen hydrolase family protein [Polyangiaceae bacterium]